MASLRKSKKMVAYLTGEVISNCYLAIYFQPESAKDEIISIIDEAVALHNSLIEQINHPAEKHNKSLVRKHYRAVNQQMFDGVDELFNKISKVCQK